MNINWVLGNTVSIPATVDIAQLKNIGSLWGGWQTWRGCQTDNVICHDFEQAQLLIDTGFSTKCNLYIPETLYQTLASPPGIFVYGGEFSHKVNNKEEIIAMHLASTVSDVVLLLGLDWSTSDSESQKHYCGMMYHVIQSTPKTQWVMINPPKIVPVELTKLNNFSTDTLSKVFELLSN